MKKIFACLIILILSNITTSNTASEPPMTQIEPLSMVVEISTPINDISQEEDSCDFPTESESVITREEIELLAICVMSEAEGECEQGQRLVIDSVLNRVDNLHFPDTISEVIWQKNQYAGMYGDRITRCYVMDELVKLVEEELENRTDYDVVFFNAGHYSDYGVPMFQVGNHYFSSYD